MDTRFLSAFSPKRHTRLFGRTLKPFTLRHRVILLNEENPIVMQGAAPDYYELLRFVEVVSDKEFNPLSRWFYIGYLRYSKWYRESVIKRLNKYQAGQMHTPKFWEQNKAKKVDNCPPVLSAVVWLIHNGFKKEDAWNTPECQVMWYTAAFGIVNGSETKFLTTEEEALLDSLIKETEINNK